MAMNLREVPAPAMTAAAVSIGVRRYGWRVVLCALLLSTVHGCSKSSSPQDVWLETGAGDGQVVYPRGITYSPNDDTFFVVDRMARVQHFDRKGRFLNGWRMPKFDYGKPVGISVGPDGNVYIPDTHNFRVMVYTPAGQVVRQWGERGTGPGQFIYPTDVAFDEHRNVFVSEYGDHDRVQVFSPEGKFLYQFGSFGTGDGEFSRPQSMVIDHGLVYITDACNHRICVFKTDGTWVRNMGRVGSGPGEFRFPYGLDEDAEGNLIVCEFGNNRAQRIDKATGRGLGTWGTAGREPGQLAYPWAVMVDRRDRVIVVDSGNNRLQVFEF
jgi:DNA-binding beta-propeller fold protein YncE